MESRNRENDKSWVTFPSSDYSHCLDSWHVELGIIQFDACGIYIYIYIYIIIIVIIIVCVISSIEAGL